MPKRKRNNEDRPQVHVITSAEAATKIRAATSNEKKLVVVTGDSSGNGRCSGLAAFVRTISGNGDDDTLRVAIGSLQYDESSVAEIAAVALGARAAMREVGENDVSDVLFLCDCISSVVSFYQPNKKSSIRSVVGADEWVQNMNDLLDACSTSSVCLAWVRSTHSKYSGFFDHEAADLVSAAARSEQFRNEYRDELSSSELAPALTDSDLQWLESSAEKKKKSGGSGKRKDKCRSRLKEIFPQVTLPVRAEG